MCLNCLCVRERQSCCIHTSKERTITYHGFMFRPMSRLCSSDQTINHQPLPWVVFAAKKVPMSATLRQLQGRGRGRKLSTPPSPTHPPLAFQSPLPTFWSMTTKHPHSIFPINPAGQQLELKSIRITFSPSYPTVRTEMRRASTTLLPTPTEKSVE